MATKDGDANAGIAGHVGCTVNAVQYTTCTTYDSTYKTLAVGSGNALNQSTSTGYTSNAAGGFDFWPTSDTDFNGQTSTFEYDSLGRMTATTLPLEGTGQKTKQWVYTVWCTATGPQTPCVELDEIDRIDATTTVTSRAFYDGFGRLVETRSPGPSGQDVVAYAFYDESGDLYFESTSYLVAAYTGAPGAAAFSVPDVLNQVGMTKERDALDRVTKVTDPLSQQTTTSYTVVCSAFGGDGVCYEQTTIIDPLSHKKTSANDAGGRLAYSQRYTGNSGGTYALYATGMYQYDANGNLVTITHPDGTTTTSFAFDATGQKTSQSDPDTGTTTYSYDKNGNLTQMVDARGSGGGGVVYAGYDGLDRLLWRNTTNSPSGARVSYTYDSTAGGNIGVGRLSSTTFTGPSGSGLSGSYSYLYDARGRAISSTTTVNGTPYTIAKTYDSAGNTLTQTYPTGEVVTSGFTGNNWLGQITRTQGGATLTLADNLSYSGSVGAAGTITGMRLGDNTFAYAASYDAATLNLWWGEYLASGHGDAYGAKLRDISWHLTVSAHKLDATKARVARFIDTDTIALDQLHEAIKAATTQGQTVITYVGRALALPYNERGVYGHFITLGGIDSDLGYLVGNGDDVNALGGKGIIPCRWYGWNQLVAAQINGMIALEKVETMSNIPQGWKDDGKTLVAPNGVPVVRGFREWVLSHGWDANNTPLKAELGIPSGSIEPGNATMGPGSRQDFRFKSLGWTTKTNVYEIAVGQDIVALETQLAASLAHVTQLEQMLAEAQQPQPQPAPVQVPVETPPDPKAVEALAAVMELAKALKLMAA